VTHYSESASKREGRDCADTAHSNFVDGPVNDWGLDIDCVIEAKAKELAVMQLTKGVNLEGKYDELRGVTEEELQERTRLDKEKRKIEKRKAKELTA